MSFQNSMYNIKIEKFTKEAPLIFACGFTFLIVVLIIKFAIMPLVVKSKSLTEEINNYKNLINSEATFSRIKEEIKTKIDNLQTILDVLTEQKKQGGTETSGYLEKLMEVARESDVKFVRIEPQSIENQTPSDMEYSQYPVLLTLTTGYNEAGRFISSLEKKPYLFKVERVAIDARKDEKCDIKILVTCLIPKEKGVNAK